MPSWADFSSTFTAPWTLGLAPRPGIDQSPERVPRRRRQSIQLWIGQPHHLLQQVFGQCEGIVSPLGQDADAGRKKGDGAARRRGRDGRGGVSLRGRDGPDDPGLVLDLRYASTQPRRRADRLRGSILVQLHQLIAFALTPLITLCDNS
jgi:hypothetical protein